MSRVEQIGDCTLYLGDCLEILPEMGKVDAVVTDPPFFAPASHYQSRISWGRSYADLSILGQYFFDLAEVFKRIIDDAGHLFVFCNDESYPVFYPGAYGLWDFTAALVWDKTRIGLGKVFRHQYELILWASNAGAYAKSDGKAHGDILSYAPTLSSNREHPVQKPPELMQEIIEICTKPGGVVLDSHMGSGTTLEAAIRCGRKAIGIELNSHYFDIACRRIEEAYKQPKLFKAEVRKPEPQALFGDK